VKTSSDNPLLAEVIRHTVETVRPLRIILFGSAARGDMDANSDLDLLIVMPDGTNRRHTARRVYRALAGLGMPKDIIAVTEEDVRRYGDDPGLVICPALNEGKDLYCAP